MQSLHDEIAKVAQELFEKSGRVPGRDLENWLEAERIVKARRGHGDGGDGKEQAKESKPKKAPAKAAKRAETKKTAPKKPRAKKSEEPS